MSAADSSSSSSAADSSRKRALSPAAAQLADVTAAPQPQQPLHSPIAPPPQKRARKNLLPAHAFSADARNRALTLVPVPVAPRWSDLSPAQRCFSDGLALAFSFLTLSELVLAAVACKAWREAAKRSSVPGVTVSCGVACRSRAAMAASPFRRHVHALANVDADAGIVSSADASKVSWSLLDLKMLQHLPQLRRISGLRIELAADSDSDELDFTFPPRLKSADLLLSFDYGLVGLYHELLHDWPQTSLLRALRPCRSLTRLSITVLPECRLSTEALHELPTLQILTLDIKNASDGLSFFQKEQIVAVKQLPNLRRLTLRERNQRDADDDDPDGTGWLRWLCLPPHRLQQLQELDLNQHRLDLEHMELLQRLPALTELAPSSMYDSSLPLLPAFASRLQRLHLRVRIADIEVIGPELWDFDNGFVRAPLFLPHLTPCTALIRLALYKCVFSEAEAETLCRALPELQALALQNVGWPSFEPLRHLPLLEVLLVDRAVAFPLHVDAVHFKPLQQLRRLVLTNVSLLDEAVIAALRPPSALLPGLVQFQYWP